ncbi:MAG TPA: trypsin-like peptidase domain-containing protein, partial [Prosthecobacter sp.]|nr:trypsin-like peptidase domain-containing protein [Prosthecobacter sp.]
AILAACMDHLRRLLFAFFVFFAAFLLFSVLRRGQDGYGLMEFLRGEKPSETSFTAAGGPKLNLEDVQVLNALSEESSKLSAAVLPSVVSVNTRTLRRGQTAWHPFFGLVRGRAQVIPGLGSGAIISKEGHVITNYHVIADVNEVLITTNDNKQFPAIVLGASPERDVAVLKIDSKRNDFPALNFANSDLAKVGQLVFAVGNPFGLSGTVTQGIISARDRHLSDGVLDYLQTDTVINPGNSGGPLINIRGEILGINVAIYRGDENVRAWQGIGLAIPSNSAKKVVDEILGQAKGGPAPTAPGVGYIGLVLSEEPVVIDSGLGAAGRYGAFVTALDPNSPAVLGGLAPGDVITALDGKTFDSPNRLLELIRELTPGSIAKVSVIRNGRNLDLNITVGRRTDAGAAER